MKAIAYLSTLVVACTIGKGLGAVNFTVPASGSVIANFEGTENATTITCNVTNSQGDQISTQWTLGNFRGNTGLQTINNAAPELFEITGDPIVGTMFTFTNHLTVVNLVRDLDRVTVFCGTGAMPQQANFVLRIYQTPVLQDNFFVRIEENSENVPVDLRQEPAAFPEPTSFRWYKDGQRLVTEADRPLTYSNVTFSTIGREDAGNYTVSATNFIIGSNTEQVGNDTGSFYLDVIYGPSFRSDGPTQVPTQRYVLLENPLSLVCGRGLDSNPAASVTWRDPNNMEIMDNDRYDLESGTEVVRLNFTRTIPTDTGIWTCEVTVRSERHVVNNEGNLVQGAVAVIGTPIQHEFMVTVIERPGQPVTLREETVGATWIQITWESPLVVDFPISRYEVIARATENPDVIIRNMSTPNNNTFVNVTDLIPGTIYNFSVVAVIEVGEVVARGAESASLGDIMTGFTVPNISCPRPVSRNGNIMASWSYVHTGGLPLTNLSVMYSYEEGTSTVSRSVDVNLNDLTVTVSGLVAGEEYTFTVTAENSNGSSSTVCEPVDHIIGVPAEPQFGDLITGPNPGVITVQIKTVASGVNSPDHDFRFNITPVLAGIRQPERIFRFPMYVSGQFVSIAVDQLRSGESYTFSATAMNTFGNSMPANSPPQFAGGDSLPPPSSNPPPSNPPPSPGDTSNSTAIAVGVAIPVIILAIVVVIVVLLILFIFLRRNKDHGNYKVEGGKYHKASTSDPGARVYEEAPGVDIGADLVKAPKDTEHEIQYAELDTFRPPSQQKNNSNEAKPVQPEEPVEYAVITTFKKKEDPPAADSSAVPDPTPEAADANNDADKAGTSTTLV